MLFLGGPAMNSPDVGLRLASKIIEWLDGHSEIHIDFTRNAHFSTPLSPIFQPFPQ
jgi:hypothetical protein